MTPVISLGKLPLTDNLLPKTDLDNPETLYDLDLDFCTACSLFQVGNVPPPNTIFNDEYHYYSSVSQTLLEHSQKFAEDMKETLGLGANSNVIEIACIDGVLLKYLMHWASIVWGSVHLAYLYPKSGNKA